MPDTSRDVVLVHGTTQGPSGWQRLRSALSGRGYRVHLVDLPVDRPDLPADGYAQLAADQCGRLEAPVVVGHSAAGLLLPAIGRRLGAARLVWLSAVVPDPGGQSFTEEVEAHGDTMFGAEWLALREPPTVDPVVAAYFLFHDCPLETLRWALTTLRLFVPRGAYRERPQPLGDLPPCTVIVPRHGRSLRPEWMRRSARVRLGVAPVEVDGGHCPHISRPDQVAQIIDDAVRGEQPAR